jgi:hypothetical protein
MRKWLSGWESIRRKGQLLAGSGLPAVMRGPPCCRRSRPSQPASSSFYIGAAYPPLGHKAANCPMRGAVAKTLTQSLNCRGCSEIDLKILDVCRSPSEQAGARMKIETAYHLKCSLCEGTGWVCVLHRDHPWNGPRACGCGVTGVPCPSCNLVAGDELPRMPKAFTAKEISDEPLVSQR